MCPMTWWAISARAYPQCRLQAPLEGVEPRQICVAPTLIVVHSRYCSPPHPTHHETAFIDLHIAFKDGASNVYQALPTLSRFTTSRRYCGRSSFMIPAIGPGRYCPPRHRTHVTQ